MRWGAKSSAILALFTGSGMQIAANLAVGLLSTLLLPVAERGEMVVILTSSSLVAMVFGLGLGNAYRHLEPRPEFRGRVAATYTRTASVVVLVAATVGAIASSLLLQRLDAVVVVAAMLSAGVQTAITFLTDARFALGHFMAGA